MFDKQHFTEHISPGYRVGLFFITQNPTDVPADVLGQLGLKVQHALRAFTAKDRKAIKLAAENFPLSDFYDTKNELTTLGIGEALVTALDEKGRPTPLAATMLRAPMSRMDILTDPELEELINTSTLKEKYNQSIDRESAYEILIEKIERADQATAKEKAKEERQKVEKNKPKEKCQNKYPISKTIIKILTSATFIRGVMGVINKFLK